MPSPKMLIIEGSTRSHGATQKHVEALIAATPPFDHKIVNLHSLALPLFVDHRADGDWSAAEPTLILLDAMADSEVVVLASPVYWFAVSHLMKNFLDYWTFFMRAGEPPNRYFLQGKRVFPLLVASHKQNTDIVFSSLRAAIEYVGGQAMDGFLGFGDREGNTDPESLQRLTNWAELIFFPLIRVGQNSPDNA